METRRVTMAQALLGFLKNQYVERDGREHRFFEGAWGIFGHGIIAGFGQALQQNPGLSLLLVPQRAGGRAHRDGFRQGEKAPERVRVPFLHRARRHQHDHGRRHGHDQPHPGAAAAGGHLRPPQRRAGAAATGERTQPGHLRERRVQAGLALLGSDQPAGPASLLGGGGDARADLAGADRRGDAGAAAGRADRSLGLSGGDVREARVAHPAAKCRSRSCCSGRRRPSARPGGR